MAELIFKEDGENQNLFQTATPQCFQFYKIKLNVTDIVNKSSVSFFIITKVAEKNSGVVAVRNYNMTCKNKHRS